MIKRIVVLGGGFAGLWSAVGAARVLDASGAGADRVEIVLIDRTAWHSIRVRNYAADLEGTRVALDGVLGPIAVRRLEGEVSGTDIVDKTVAYDRLVFALDSLPVEPSLKIKRLAAEFAAGDSAWFLVDGVHCPVMSCQHGRPMGRFAGHSVACDLLGQPTLPAAVGGAPGDPRGGGAHGAGAARPLQVSSSGRGRSRCSTMPPSATTGCRRIL